MSLVGRAPDCGLIRSLVRLFAVNKVVILKKVFPLKVSILNNMHTDDVIFAQNLALLKRFKGGKMVFQAPSAQREALAHEIP